MRLIETVWSSQYFPVADLGFLKGGFTEVQVDYSNSTHCYIMAREEVLYVYAEAMEEATTHVKRGKISEFRTFEIASAGFSGTIQRALVRWSLGLPHLFHRPCFLLLMACQTYYNFTPPTNFTALHF